MHTVNNLFVLTFSCKVNLLSESVPDTILVGCFPSSDNCREGGEGGREGAWGRGRGEGGREGGREGEGGRGREGGGGREGGRERDMTRRNESTLYLRISS